MVDTSGFLERWAAFCHNYTSADAETRTALLHEVLERGLDPAPGSVEPLAVDSPVRLECERALIAASRTFDEFGYFWHNRDIYWYLCGHDEQLRHFVRWGWRELRHPYPGFDLWWYWLMHLHPGREDLNPVVHYLTEGRHLGYATVPEAQPPRPATPLAERSPRRICLFAGFDADGMIDDTVVAYVADLSRFADVYYLADCLLEPGELDKLTPYTRGRWAQRHGRYDFGSYSMLARDLVGWDIVETYDELILANDSCYLVQPFDQVFAKMDRSVADWWGLQATYDYFTTREFERLGRPLRLDEVEDAMRALDVWGYSEFIHVGSYFVAFRSAVIKDPEFRRRLDTVSAQSNKTTIIMKYEIGLSRYLILAGYHMDTFVDGILPYHPVYRASAFDQMRHGFPLLKRQFLYENPFSTPDLRHWKERVLAEAPGADVASMEHNLLRVAPAWNLYRSFAIRTGPGAQVEMPKPIGPDDFAEEDEWTPKHQHWWVFAVDPVSHRLEGNARAVFEAVAADPSICKLVLTASLEQKVAGENVVSHQIESAPGQFYLLRAGTIFVNLGPRSDVNHPLSGRRHRFVGLRRGTPLAAFGAALPFPDTEEGREQRARAHHDNDLTSAVVTSSEVDRQAMGSPYAPGRRLSWWVTGAPRTDLLLAADNALPADLRGQASRLADELSDRRLVLWHPADRPNGDLPLLGSDDQAWLRSWLDARGAVLGVRPPVTGPVDAHRSHPHPWVAHLTGVGALDLSASRYPDVEVVLRATDLLVSDYTDELADFPVTGRPVVCFAPDIEDFSRCPGLLHDLAEVVPGPLCRDAAALRAALKLAWGSTAGRDYEVRRAQLHAYVDGHSAARVVREVKRQYLPIDEWLAEDA